MRIEPANIPVQTSRTTRETGPLAADKALDRRRASAVEGYAKNSPPQPPDIIDAEYVEFYTPSTRTFNQERNVLDSSLEPPERSEAASEPAARRHAPPVANYQRQAAPDPPLPGTFIDIFA